MLIAKQFIKFFAVLILSLGLLAISSVVRAQGTIDVSDNATVAGTNWTYAYDNTTGFGEFTVTGDVTITGSTTINQITIADGITANITLSNASIDLHSTPLVAPVSGLSAFYIGNDATVNLTIVGNNKLTSSGYAGIQVLDGSALTIDGTNADTLIASGDNSGIGDKGSMGNVTINGGTITATGGTGGAGIGGGCASSTGIPPFVIVYSTIKVTGGNVTATGGQGGAGIGGGDCVIEITGGTVDAYGGQYGAGIGGDGAAGSLNNGSLGSPGGTIVITGGTVNATGGENAAGIGGGYGGGAINLTSGSSGVGGAGGDILISGGTVSAYGNGWGAGIGGGGGGPAGGAGFGTGGTGGAAGNILIYGESTQVTAKKGASVSAKDIGAGASVSVMGAVGNVFVALIPANLTLSSPPAATKNDVLFTASATTVDTVEMTLLAPFNAAPFGTGSFDLLSGLGPTGKTLSIITSFAAQTASFSLTGFSNSPITDTGTRLMISGTSVNFTALGDIVIDLAQITVTAPTIGATPDTVASGTGNFTISAVTWSPADATFKSGTTYTASVTLTPNAGYTFAGGLTVATIDGNTATVTYDAVSGTAVLTYQFMLRNPPANTPVPVLNSAMLLGLLTFLLMMVATFRQKWQ